MTSQSNSTTTPIMNGDGRMAVKGNTVEQFMVAYAKIVVDKEDGITLQGVYFGGIGDTLTEAEQIARECVNSIRGGTVLPRVVKLDGECQVIDALYEATERFERITENMVESEQILNRGRRKT